MGVQQHVKDSSTNTANHFHMFLSPCICILNNEDPLPQEQSVFSKELSLFDAMHAIVAFIGFPGHFISACMHELVCSGLATGGTELNHKKCTLSTEFLPLCDVLVSVEAPNDTITHSSHLVLYESQREQKRDGRRRRSGLMAERLCRDS